MAASHAIKLREKDAEIAQLQARLLRASNKSNSGSCEDDAVAEVRGGK